MNSAIPTLRDALTGTPGVTASAWRRMSWLRRYLIVSRAALLPLTVHACLLGGLLALPWTPEEGWRLVLVTASLVFAHAASNLLNDQVNWLTGTDRDGPFRMRYGAHPLAQGFINPAAHALLLLGTALVAVGLGLLVCRLAGPPAYWLASAGALLLMFYVWPLKRLGLGEVAVLLTWGPLMVGGVYWCVSGDWGPEILVLSVVAGLGPAVVVLANHTDKMRDDRARGIGTLPVLRGPVRAPRLLAVIALAQMAGGLGWMWVTQRWSYGLMIIAVPALTRLVWTCLKRRPTARPKGYPTRVWPLWYTGSAFRFASATGLALVLAALLDGL
jgi:1,4-dihydroxy-2-naphthoate octaprenyltransferase